MKSADHDKWEMNRMIIGGAMKRDNEDDALDFENIELEEERALLIVLDTKPPFLDGK
jgi:pre-mRNA-splicing factor ATP-dependent RNA helicase DHX38/PRP16